MPTLFTRIIDGDLPGHFVWRDDVCVAFLSIGPIQRGHTLVVPRAEVDHWIDLDSATTAHCFEVARVIGRAQMEAFSPVKIGVIVAGLEVPHTHVHVLPFQTERDLDFAKAASSVPADELAAVAEAIRERLRAAGAEGVSA